jgi:hypothetical protein
VYDFLDVMANYEPFTDQILTDWSTSVPSAESPTARLPAVEECRDPVSVLLEAAGQQVAIPVDRHADIRVP